MKPHPATHGAVVASVSLGTFHITEASYAPGATIPLHDHARAGWTLTLDGVYAERFRRREYVAPRGAVLGKPASARHCNRYGPEGARCFLIGVDADHATTHPGVARALREITFHARGPIPAIVGRMHREFLTRDTAWTLVLEGLVLDLAAYALRLARRPALGSVPPRWLIEIRELLEESFAQRITFASLAAAAGVHPVHLSRAFRAAYGTTPGDHLREARIERAKHLLAHSDAPISQIAVATGFCDQSHLTRTFGRTTGTSPAAYRARHLIRGSRGANPRSVHSRRGPGARYP